MQDKEGTRVRDLKFKFNDVLLGSFQAKENGMFVRLCAWTAEDKDTSLAEYATHK